jgi:hypothetical protein
LRNDLPPGERWAISSVSTAGVGTELRKANSRSALEKLKGNRVTVHEESDIGMGMCVVNNAGNDSEECILDGLSRERSSRGSLGTVIGVTRTVVVVSDRKLAKLDEG